MECDHSRKVKLSAECDEDYCPNGINCGGGNYIKLEYCGNFPIPLNILSRNDD